MLYLNSKTPGPNPSVILARSEAHHSGNAVYGGACLAQMMPARASTTLDYYVPPYPAEVDGRVTCLTEVVPWPYSADTEGIAFDQANLWGVRTVCWRRPDADGAGDKEWWTAVPRTLPAGYTSVGRCGITTLIGNHLSGIGSYGSVSYSLWNHRTPTGLLWDMSIPAHAAKAGWSPMNLNDTFLSASFNNYSAYYVPKGGYQSWESYLLMGVAGDHIGFRGAKFVAVLLCPGFGPTYPLTISESFTVYCQSSLDQVSDPWTDGAPPTTFHSLGSFTISNTFALPSSPHYSETFTFSTLVPPVAGILQGFYVVQTPLSSAAASRWQVSCSVKFAPRTDVPLWYFSSMANNVAPGGYIA